MRSRSKGLVVVGVALCAGLAGGCVNPHVATDLDLRKVVLYRNGVGYFERGGNVEGDRIRFRVRRDHVGDFLSSLAVVTERPGAVRGVSFPSLERQVAPPAPPPPCNGPPWECPTPAPPAPPDPMMDVVVELGDRGHVATVAYVVEAPVWRPTYRIVLGEPGRALVQGWAVVQNLSGEDWNDVALTVTEGAPLTFRADLATPFIPRRPVVTDYGEVVQAPVASTVSIGTEAQRRVEAEATVMGFGSAADYGGWADDATGYYAGDGAPAAEPTAPARAAGGSGRMAAQSAPAPGPRPSAPSGGAPPPPPPPPDMGATGAGRSLAMLAARTREGGITRYESTGPVTVPDGSSTLIAILNEQVSAREGLLYEPDPGVPDSRSNPFRVVRFTNETGVGLERGPVAVLGRSQFLGQGILAPVPPGATSSIPFALERSVGVEIERDEQPEEGRLVRIVRGRATVQRFTVLETKYTIRNLGTEAHDVWIRHGRRSGYELKTRPEGTEDLPDGAVLLPTRVDAAGTTELEVTEQSPVRVEVEILTPLARDAIVLYLSGPAVDAVAGPVLRRVIDVSARLDEMQAERTALEERRRQTQQMMQEIRADLAVLGTTPRSVEIRERLTRDLDRLTTEFQDLTARIVEIGSRASEMRVELAEAVRDLDLTVEAEGGSSGAPR
jgi:hypothetical protein